MLLFYKTNVILNIMSIFNVEVLKSKGITMSYKRIAVLGIGLYLLTFNSIAGEKIYRWVDKNGVTHFSQIKPTDSKAKNVEEVIVRTSRGYKSPEDLELQANKNGKSVESFDAIAKKNCAVAQQNAKVLSAFKNITQEDKDGNPVKLSEEERKEQLELANKQIALFCKP